MVSPIPKERLLGKWLTRNPEDWPELLLWQLPQEGCCLAISG
jgi:hypothetical protein